MKIKSWLPSLVILTTAFGSTASPITNSVFITPLLTFTLRGQQSADGKSYILPQTQFRANELIYRWLEADPKLTAPGTVPGMDSIYYRALPLDQTFDFKLFDERGEEVTKTEHGLANSKAAIPPKGMSDRNKFKPQAVGHPLRQMFRPDEMFKIKSKGVYELEVRMRLCMVMTNGVLDFEAMTNGSKFASASNFGVITSPPVRVQVIKD